MIPPNLFLTAATNFLASVVFAYCGAKLGQQGKAFRRTETAFLLFALGFFLAGLIHGFYEPNYHPGSTDGAWILISSWSIAALAQYLFSEIILRRYNQKLADIFRYLGLVYVAFNTAMGLWTLAFYWVSLNALPLLIAGIYYGIKKWKEPASRNLLGGLGLMAAGSIVQFLQIKWLWPLDHNVLYHLFVIASVPCFYHWAVKELIDKSQN